MPVMPLYRRASRQSPLETQLIRGEVFAVHDVKRGWAAGQAQSPITGSPYSGYKGFVPIKYLQPFTSPPNVIVTALCAPAFKAADIKSPVKALWPMNARCKGALVRDFYETDAGFLHQKHVRLIDKSPLEGDFVTIAERHVGRPYIWGGVVSDGLDCSGLVQASLRATGQDAPRDSGDQEGMGRAVGEGKTLRRGDLIFWKGHVGIMQDAERLLHANAFHMAVASEPLVTATKRIANSGQQITNRRRLSITR